MTDTIDTSEKAVRKFGLMFGLLSLLAAAWSLYRGHVAWPWLSALAASFFAAGLLFRPLLRPVYRLWMKFAFILGWLNTRLILGLFFYLIMLPIGLFLRLTGKDLLDQRIERSAPSYWKKRPAAPRDPSHAERMF